MLANNTSNDIDLYSIPPKSSKHFTESIIGSISDDIVKLNKFSSITVPYIWLYENRTLWILTYKDKSTIPQLLIEKLMNLYKTELNEIGKSDIMIGKIPLKISADRNDLPMVLKHAC